MVQALAALAQRWIKGELPDCHAKYWCGATLTPLRKLDDGVRPVAVGETLRRLVGKILLATGVAKAQVAVLSPLQVGVGIRSATESVAMGLQAVVDSLALTSDWAVLKVDLRNAFNTVDRQAVLSGALHYTPATYNYLRYAYSGEVPLFVGGAQPDRNTPGLPAGTLGVRPRHSPHHAVHV